MFRNTCWRCGGTTNWVSDFTYDEVRGKCERCTKEICEGVVSILSCDNCGADIEYINRCKDYTNS